MANQIVIKGARENNLKNIDVTIPRDKLVVLTGLSGSGKSSLAFETLYAEGISGSFMIAAISLSAFPDVEASSSSPSMWYAYC